MTAVMKFNRKVYVVPEEKYHAMSRDAKSREASTSSVGQEEMAGEGEGDRAAETHSPESGGVIRAASSEEGGERAGHGKSEEPSPSTPPAATPPPPSSALGRDKARNLSKVAALLAPYAGGKVGGKNFAASLLHTQSPEYPPPRNFKNFYALLLEKAVPPRLIGNERLRRVLHYLKNKTKGKAQSKAKSKKKRVSPLTTGKRKAEKPAKENRRPWVRL